MDKNFDKIDPNSDNSDHFQDLLRVMDQRKSRQSIEDKLRELENMGSSDYNGDRGYNDRDFDDREFDRGYDRDNQDGFDDFRVSKYYFNIQNKSSNLRCRHSRKVMNSIRQLLTL